MLFTNVGIAIITYNRPNFLESCLNSVFNFPTFNAEIAVFDDASLDNSCEIASKYCKYFSGKSNEGVVVNKNRALYYFTEISPKDIIIILEDDVNVESCNWISDWTDAASKYGHMNYIPPWFFDPSLSDNFVSGLGSVADPYIFTLVTGQCTSVRADLIRSSVGYLNPLFKGYGHGHVDWTLRFINLDYGGRHTSSGHNFFLALKAVF